MSIRRAWRRIWRKATARTTTEFLLGIIPNTFVGAFSEGNVLQVLFVSVLCGFALSAMGQAGKPLTDLIGTAAQMFFRIVGIVMWAAPIGAFGAIAFTVGKFGADSLLSLGKLLISFYATCLIFILVVLWPVAHLCRRQSVSLHRLYPRRVVDRDRDHVVGDRAAAHDRKARSRRVRRERRRTGHSHRLFVQSRRHLPLSRDRGGVPGAGDQYAVADLRISSSCWPYCCWRPRARQASPVRPLLCWRRPWGRLARFRSKASPSFSACIG